MLEDFTYDFLLQVCEGVQDKVKVYKKKKVDSRYCEKCNVERIPLGFYVCPSCDLCGDNIFVVGYDGSTLIHKKGKCIYKRDEYLRSKIGKFLCREPFKIPDRVTRLLEGELHNSKSTLYFYSQVDSLTIPILEQLLKRKKE